MNTADYNVGLGYLAGVARAQGAEVEILDPYDPLADPEKRLARRRFTALGFTVHHLNVEATLALCRRIRESCPETSILLGGHHATATAREILRDHDSVDAVCAGEGEDVLAQVVGQLAAGDRAGGSRPRGVLKGGSYSDLESLPFPEPRGGGIARISTSRGCPYDCSFCTTPGIRKLLDEPVFRGRSSRHIVAELTLLHQRGISRVRINDDLYITRSQASHDRALTVAEALIEQGSPIAYKAEFRIDSFAPADLPKLRRLQQSGLREVFLGVESGSERILKEYQKRITVSQIVEMLRLYDEAGIVVNAGNILASPDCTRDDICRSIEVFEQIGMAYLFFRRVTFRAHVFPGTELERRLEAEGRLERKPSYLPRAYTFLDPHIDTVAGLFEEAVPRFLGELGGEMFELRKQLLERCYRGELDAARLRPLLADFNTHSAALLIRWFRDTPASGLQAHRFASDFADFTARVGGVRDQLAALARETA